MYYLCLDVSFFTERILNEEKKDRKGNSKAVKFLIENVEM